ncbi:MAG: hypothetical protein M0R03_07470 [Novosphingobium sp.]|nr:hypothetical protein [Novosphingobium sp.]
MIEPGGADMPLPRASLRVGGASVARHQLGLALAFECQRVICLVRNMTSDVVDLQHAAEAAHAGFHVVTSAQALVAQVTAHDEVVVFGDGLLPDGECARELLSRSGAVLVQPIESGLAAGFERIDLNHASAGLMRIPGRLIERLAELPADCDVVSALTRIALQSGVPMREVPQRAREGRGWRLIRNEDDAHAAEDALIADRVREWDRLTPGLMLARAGVTAFGPPLMQGGYGSMSLALGAFALLALALGAGWLDLTATGLLFCGAAWLVLKAMALVQRIEKASLNRTPFLALQEQGLGWLLDAVIVVLVVWRAPLLPWESVVDRVFPPVVLIGLLRLLPLSMPRGWAAWLEDRTLLVLLLAALGAAGVLRTGIPGLAVALVVAGLALGGGIARITRS